MANRISASVEEFTEKLVALNRVVKVTKGGRTFTFAAIVVVGDGEMFKDDYAKRHTEGLYEFYSKFSTDEKYGTRI